MARKSRGSGALGILFSLVWTATLLVLAVGVYLLWDIHRPGPSTQDKLFTVQKGASATAIARELKSIGAIRDPVEFRIAAELYAVHGALKAGAYEAEAGESLRSILEKIEAGRMKLYPVTVAEGLTSAMIADILNASPVLQGPAVAPPPEGSLLPETYMVPQGENRAAVLKRMRDDQQKLLDDLWEKRAPDLPLATKEDAVTLASIVEKETGVATERAHVAGVFINRLKRGIPLQSDPTIIYGVSQGRPLGRGIRKSELERRTPYNTYFITGLTPTPIANPGKDAIAAVLNPLATEDLYFVADGSGGHVFAKTVEEHNANVARWRETERQLAQSRTTP